MNERYANLPPEQPGLGIDPSSTLPTCHLIKVNGREEHEALLRDPARMQELGLDSYYETIVYLKRWGGWLKNEDSP